MDKRMKRKILTLYSNGMNAHDITIQHNLDPRAEYTVTTMQIEDVLREMGAADPNRRIPQKPDIQPDMPKQFISISESKKQRSKHKIRKKRELTEDAKHWHSLACGFVRSGYKALRCRDIYKLERLIKQYEAMGYTQVGEISSDFAFDGDTYLAVMKKGDQSDAR